MITGAVWIGKRKAYYSRVLEILTPQKFMNKVDRKKKERKRNTKFREFGKKVFRGVLFSRFQQANLKERPLKFAI